VDEDRCAALYEAYVKADEASRAKSADLWSHRKGPDGQYVAGSRGVDQEFLAACSALANARDDAHQAWLACLGAEAVDTETAGAPVGTLIGRQGWMTDVDTVTLAIHTVYCGIMADHDQPNEKDREQARQLIAAIGQSIGSGAAASSR